MVQEKFEDEISCKAFEFQNWSVYQKGLEVASRAHQICKHFPAECGVGLRDQFRRASQSISMNIAEGSSRFSPKDKANFFRTAKGSVFECVAVLDLAQKFGLADEGLTPIYKDLETVGRMLSGLIKFVEGRRR